MRVRRGPATVTGERTPSTATGATPGRPGRAPIREPGHCPAAAIIDPADAHNSCAAAAPDQTWDEDPEEGPPCAARRAGSRPGDPPAVHLGHRPARPRARPAPRGAPPTRTASPTCPRCSTEADVVVVRVLGGRRYWEEGIDAVLASGMPVVALGGEQAPDAEMMELSTVPAGVAAQAHTYLAQGGPENLAQLHAFLSDTVLLTGEGFAPPVELPSWGILDRDRDATRTARPSPSSTTAPSSSRGTPPTSRRCAPRSRTPAAGRCRCSAPRCGRPSPRCCGTLRAADAMVVTVLAAGGTKPASASAGGDDEAWDVARAGRAGRPDPAGPLPHQQPRRLGGQRRRPLAARRRDPGRRPRVRRPADHRAVLVQGVRRRRAVGLRARPRARRPRRRDRGAPRPAAAHPERGQADRAHAVSAYPTKHARIGNAVGLDTPASAVALLRGDGRGRLLRSGQGRSRLPGRRRAGRRTR